MPKKQVNQADNVALIGIEDFVRLQLKTATVIAAERVVNTDKLLKLQVDCGGGDQRQIVAGIAAFYEPEAMLGKTVIVVCNLQPVALFGIESQGMLLAAKHQKKLRLLSVDGELPPGARVS